MFSPLQICPAGRHPAGQVHAEPERLSLGGGPRLHGAAVPRPAAARTQRESDAARHLGSPPEMTRLDGRLSEMLFPEAICLYTDGFSNVWIQCCIKMSI